MKLVFLLCLVAAAVVAAGKMELIIHKYTVKKG
jgi:hypothetical protein